MKSTKIKQEVFIFSHFGVKYEIDNKSKIKKIKNNEKSN